MISVEIVIMSRSAGVSLLLTSWSLCALWRWCSNVHSVVIFAILYFLYAQREYAAACRCVSSSFAQDTHFFRWAAQYTKGTSCFKGVLSRSSDTHLKITNPMSKNPLIFQKFRDFLAMGTTMSHTCYASTPHSRQYYLSNTTVLQQARIPA